MAIYNSNLPYDYDIPYNEGDTIVLVGSTQFALDSGDNNASAGASVILTTTEFLLEALPTAAGGGDSVEVETKEFSITSGIDYYLFEVIEFSGEPVPTAHMEDAQKLDADAYIELFQIVLSDGINKLYLKMDHDVTWQGNDYEGTGIKLDGVASHASEEVSRPNLTLFNPEGVYSSLIDDGLLDGARVIRYRVLKDDVENDRPIYRVQQWKISRISGVKRGVITTELRDLVDGQTFMVPYRMFIPPEFPTVSIQ